MQAAGDYSLHAQMTYLWKCACVKEHPGRTPATSSVFTGFLKAMSEFTALKLLKS